MSWVGFGDNFSSSKMTQVGRCRQFLGRGLNILKYFGSGDERTGGEGGQGRPNLAGGPGISVKLPSFYDFLVWWGFFDWSAVGPLFRI